MFPAAAASGSLSKIFKMIYLFHGTDGGKAREEARIFTDTLSEKFGGIRVERIYPDELTIDKLNELVLSRGLFEKPRIIVLDGTLEDETAATMVLKEAEKMASSPDTLVLLEESVDKEKLQILKDKAEKIFSFDSNGGEGIKKEFNVWSITDAFGRRDRKEVWIYYQKAVLAGVSPEDIHGLLVWQAKNILMAKKWGSEGAQKFGIKPFVWNKAKSFSINFKNEEIIGLSSRLNDIYHNQRSGAGALGEELEKLILSL